MTRPPDTDGATENSAPPPAPTRAARTNRLAIVALITVLVAASAVFAVMAIAGPEDRTESGAAPRAGEMAASTTPTGECVSAFRQAGTRIFVTRTSCVRPHIGEIGAKVTLSPGPYRGDEQVTAEAKKKCRARVTASLYAIARGEDFDLFVDRPDEKAWDLGEHNATCVLRYPGGARTGVLRDETRKLSRLQAGDCVEKFVHLSRSVRLVDCDEAHEAEVLAVVRSEDDEFPTAEQMLLVCTRRAADVFGRRAPEGVLLRYVHANELEWVRGERYLVCVAMGKDGPLTGSVIPE